MNVPVRCHPGIGRIAVALAIAVVLAGAPAPLESDRPLPADLNLVTATDDVQAAAAWALSDTEGHGLTGRGVTICDIDGGVDIFHPMLFRADGGVFGWLDRDGDGVWSPGDAVDLDGNGLAGAGETLTWLPSYGLPDDGRDTTRFQPGYDFLFIDANENGVRDFGPPDFTEQDLCYGERLFLADDTDGNGYLDTDESVVGLGTSKFRAIFGRRILRRGVDLIDYSTPDESHGTSVCGILAGGWPGLHRYTGIAPDADLLLGLERGEESLLWAREEGADVVVYEFDGYGTDGSSSLDALVDDLSRTGIIFVAPAGNDRRPRHHATILPGNYRDFENHNLSRIGLTFFWIGPPPPRVRVEAPNGEWTILGIGEPLEPDDDWRAGISFSETWRGNSGCGLYVYATNDRPMVGRWRLSFPGWDGVVEGLHSELGYEEESWWVDGDGKYSVISPGTADSAITVGAYENDGLRDIAWFSGEGPRFDGWPVLDIAAPGVRLIVPAGDPRPPVDIEHPERPHFKLFSGTSASSPVVAGAAAVLKQAFPEMDSGLFRSLLHAGAEQDSLTTDPDRWGAGRLRITNSLAAGLERQADNSAAARLAVRCAPNPAPGPARISWLATDAVPVFDFSPVR